MKKNEKDKMKKEIITPSKAAKRGERDKESIYTKKGEKSHYKVIIMLDENGLKYRAFEME